ncbi:MAG: CHAT domain-containing protein, partial [Acidobacteriota bacterium]
MEWRREEKSQPFLGFEILIERFGPALYKARVRASPMGDTASVEIELRPLLRAVGLGPEEAGSEAERLDQPSLDPEDLGEALYHAVFVGRIAQAYRTSLVRARSSGSRLLIKLRFNEAPEAAALPWETLWDPDLRNNLAVARVLRVPEAPRPAELRQPLRILALLPFEQEGGLSGAGEWLQIQEQLTAWIDSGQVIAERVEPPTLPRLDEEIQRGCDVLHVVSHGRRGDPGQAGEIQVEGTAGQPLWVTGQRLSKALEPHPRPRLVVLSSCHGAGEKPSDPFEGLAQHLLARG